MQRWLFLVALLWSVPVAAELRPEPYDGGHDEFADTRAALRDQAWSLALSRLQRLSLENPAVVDDAEYHNLLGYALRNADPGRLAQAIGHYHEALRINPSHVQAREYLGRAYLMQGRTDLAREQLGLIERFCGGQDCAPWRSLHEAINAPQPPGR